MTNIPPSPRSALVTWVLLANDGTARIFEYDRTPPSLPANVHPFLTPASRHYRQQLALIPDGLIAADIGDADVSNASHRQGQPSNNNRHLQHQKFLPHQITVHEPRRAFAKLISDRLRRACETNAFDRLVLIAPKELIVELRQQLVAPVQRRIVGVLAKETPPVFDPAAGI